MALDKGAITDSHVLVLPIEHFPSSLHLSASAFAEMERYLSCAAHLLCLPGTAPARTIYPHMSPPYEHCSPSRACQLLQMKCHLSALHTGGTWPFMSMRWMSWQAWQLQLL